MMMHYVFLFFARDPLGDNSVTHQSHHMPRSDLVLGEVSVREVAGVRERGVEAVPEAPVEAKCERVCGVGELAGGGDEEPTRRRVAAGTAATAAAGRLGSTGATDLEVSCGRPRIRRACLALARSEVARAQNLDS